MNSQRSLNKFINSDIGGTHSPEAIAASAPSEDWPGEESLSELYAAVPPAVAKKHSADFIANRLKVRQIAETKLMHLSTELSKLADEVRYHHPLIAEILDEAWDATEEALTLMSDSE